MSIKINKNGNEYPIGVIPQNYIQKVDELEEAVDLRVRFPDYANADSNYSEYVSAGTTETLLYTATNDCYILLYSRTDSTVISRGLYIAINGLTVCTQKGSGDAGTKTNIFAPIVLKKEDVVTILKDSNVSVADVRYKIIPIR